MLRNQTHGRESAARRYGGLADTTQLMVTL
jgi:hypothetical protein